MKKNYFLAYSSSENEFIIKELLYKMFDFEFIEHESSYIGNYYTATNLFVDKLTISSNKLPDDMMQINNPFCISILKLCFINGKNSEKKSKYLYMKKQLEKIEFLFLYQDEIFEE